MPAVNGAPGDGSVFLNSMKLWAMREAEVIAAARGCFGILLQYPDTFGAIHDYQALDARIERDDRHVLLLIAGERVGPGSQQVRAAGVGVPDAAPRAGEEPARRGGQRSQRCDSRPSRCSRPSEQSSSIQSPSFTAAKGPPAAASGATCKTTVP